MDDQTVILFSRNGLGHALEGLQLTLVNKFLQLTLASGHLPAKILFYTDGVKLACSGSPVLEPLREMQQRGVELVLCQTCLETFGLAGEAQVGVVGGMGDILEALQKAGKVISV